MRARAGVRLVGWRRQAGVDHIALVSDVPLADLTLLLPDFILRAQLAHNGAGLPIRRCQLEGRQQRMVVLDLDGGKRTSLYLTHEEADRS
jgi:hypothetical protein